MPYVHCLKSLPWGEYYDQATILCHSIESWSTSLQGALIIAGYPRTGRAIHLLVYLGATIFVWILLNIAWRMIAGIMGMIWLILCWIVFSIRFICGLLYRLCIGRNRNSRNEPPSLTAAVDYNAKDNLD